MSEHTLTAEVEVKFRPVSLTEFETAYPTLEITFHYEPGYPATGPSYASGGEPGAAAEVELISATMIDPGDLSADQDPKQVQEWAADYLDTDAGYEHACSVAENDSGQDPDDAYERMREAKWEREL